MPLKSGTGEGVDPKLEKYVSQLKGPAKRTKLVLSNALEKSIKHLQEEADKSMSDQKKGLFLKKSERMTNDLNVLKILSEDDIVRFALLMLDKIMPIASNPRVPREQRMKARVAAHKPLSTILTRLKKKLKNIKKETESEAEINQQNSDSSLNKIIFNNTVVLMRKDVKRSKVHIIHKLTRNIKKLQTAKGAEEKVKKFQKKAERLRKKVIRIKELHEDEISKFALSTLQDVNQLAIDIKAPSTSQALATVTIHKFVASHVRDFRTKYPDWQKIVPKFLKKKRKKRNLKLDLKSDQSSGKVFQGSTGKHDIHSESEKELSEDDNEEESEDSAKGLKDESYIKDEESSQDDDDRSSQDDNDGSSEDDNNGSSQDNDDGSSQGDDDGSSQDDDESLNGSDDEVSNTSDNEGKGFGKKSSNKVKAPVKGNRNIQKMQIVNNHKLSKKESRTRHKDLINECSPSPPEPKIQPVKEKPKVVDPFFVTTTNEEYVTSQVPSTVENSYVNEESDDLNSYKNKKYGNSNFKNKWERNGIEGKYGKVNRFHESAPFKRNTFSNFNESSAGPKSDKLVFGNRKERRKALLQPQVEEKEEKLHPSWEAKKKQKVIIPFQGKKVIFD